MEERKGMKKIYFAGPLFSAAEKKYNEELTVRLEQAGFEVFLPQRDGAERDKPPYDAMGPEEKRRALFELDRDRVLEADIFLFVLDGQIPDEGACVELGIAYAQKHAGRADKVLVGLMTDVRAAFLGAKLNPMLSQALDRVVEKEEDLVDFLKKYIIRNRERQGGA
jgi:nucleoside 2-deoxyribosyltransferase